MLRPLAIAALIACAATAAQADTFASTQVPYGDLNIASPSDGKILASRLHAAATEVCQAANSAPSSRYVQQMMQLCVDRAVSAAITDIQSNMVRSVRVNLARYQP